MFIEAVNSHGVGDPSTRIVFRTAMPTKQMTKFTGYDINYCCKTVGVKDECKPRFCVNLLVDPIQKQTNKEAKHDFHHGPQVCLCALTT